MNSATKSQFVMKYVFRSPFVWVWGVLALLVCSAGAVAQDATALTPDAVSLPSRDGTVLGAWLFRPTTVAKGTVVALHGCGGLYARSGARKGLLNPRHQGMAELLVARGYNVLFPDSLTARGETELCTQKIGARRIDQTQRRLDALGALQWVHQQAWGQNSKVAVLGWSHGGSAVLSATDGNHREVKAVSQKFDLAIAFYPGCAAAERNAARPNTGLALMLGEKDDWTPPEPCVRWGQAVGAEVNVYPDSYHDFDNPQGAVRVRTDVPNGVNSGQGVHVGANPAARAKAYARVLELLDKSIN